MQLEEFVTKARLLVEDGAYDDASKDETLRDTLVFGISSEQVRTEAIKLGNTLTFKQVYDLAKVEENTRMQLAIINQGISTEVHAVHTKNYPVRPSYPNRKGFSVPNQSKSQQHHDRPPQKFKIKIKGCYRYGGNHQRNDPCPAKSAKCTYCGTVGHFAKICMRRKLQQLHEVNTTEYADEDYSDQDDNPYSSVIGIVTTTTSSTTHTIDTISSYPSKLFAVVKLNHKHSIKLKVDTGADTCILTTDDLQSLPFTPQINPSPAVLKGYGGTSIDHVGATFLKVTYKGGTINAKCDVVNAPPGSPSMIGCRQAQELQLITVNIDQVTESQTKKQEAYTPLSKEKVLHEYRDCFDKVGRFPGKKYHIQLVDNPKPVIHPPRSVTVHILPLYKEELQKMKDDDIITEVTEPTDWVNSITYRMTETQDGKTKLRLCLDPKDLNRNIKRAHYPTTAAG